MDTIQHNVTGRAAYSVPEVMVRLGIGRDSVYKLIRGGKLTAKKCGRRTLILEGDLQKFLEALPRIGEPDAA